MILLARFNIMDSRQSLLLGIVLFFSLLLLLRQYVISRDLKALKAQAWDLAEYENDIDRRLEQLSQKLTPAPAPKPAVVNDAALARITKLEAKLAKMEQELANAALQAPKSQTPTSLPIASVSAMTNVMEEHKIASADNTALQREQRAKARLKTALQDNKLDLHLQPIVALPTRTSAYFESFMRLQTGEKQYLDAREFVGLAEDAGLIAMIDTKVVFSSVRMLRALTSLKKRAGIFCNISGHTLSDTRAYDKIFSFLKANSAISRSLILEINQRQFQALKAPERERLGELADIGYQLSLDQVADLKLDGEVLAAAGIRFVKVPVSILLHANVDDEHLGIHPSRLASVLDKHGIALIGTEIERENEAVSLIDFDVPLGQGLLFAPPRPVKAELLDPKPGVVGLEQGKMPA